MAVTRDDFDWPSCLRENIPSQSSDSFGPELYQERVTLRPGQVFDKAIRLSKDAEEKGIRKDTGRSRGEELDLSPFLKGISPISIAGRH